MDSKNDGPGGQQPRKKEQRTTSPSAESPTLLESIATSRKRKNGEGPPTYRKRFRVSRQGVVIEVLDDKTKEAQPSSSEEESVVIEDEIYQESDTDESQGAHSESEHDYIPRAEPATDAIPTTPNDWGTLYGYQGSVPFIRHNRKSYATAVRNLLSLQLYDETKYSVVHYDAKTGKKVDEIWARVPIHREDAGQKYVSDHFHWHHDNDEKCCAFFVKRIHEDVPLSWQPTAAQLFKDIVRISYDIPCIDPNGECAPKAQCYVSLPQMKEPLEARKELSRWGANQYSPYMQTALEVLVGRDPDTFKHSFFKLFRTGTDLENTGSFYGPVLTPPSQLNLMIPVPMQTSMPLTVELHQQPIEDDHIVFMLPGHYPRRDPVQAICVKGERSEPPGPAYRFRYSLATIQALLKNAFRADYPLIRRVSLVDGVSMFDPGMITGEPLSIEMPNEPKMGDKDVDVFLSNLVQGNQRFVIIYPEWDVKDTRMIPEWEPDCHDWVEMVPLKSTLNEFITKVAELRRLSGHMMKDLSRYCISLQAVSKTVPQTNDATQAIDFPSYMVTPFTKHEEWYRIRAMIPTRDVKISILEREYTSWKLRIPKSNVWGPRYSFVDAEHKILWAEPPWRPLPLPPSAYIPRAPISDASLQKKTRAAPPERLVPAATPLDHTQARVPRQHAANSEASDIAEAAEAEEDIEELERARDIQPSIFAGHNHLLAWPSNVKLRVPTEAPLMENMLKTSENVPQVSRAILTPSEQARLQSSFWQMRNLALKRTLTCMFKDCGFSYRLGDEKALNQHLHLHHLARKCTWCDEPLYEWWNEQQRADHMRRSHKSKLLETLGVKNASLEDCASKGSVVIPLKRVHEIAGQQDRVTLSHVNDPVLATSTRARFQGEQIFCERCGRNSKLFSKIEETQHSQICQPKILNGAKCTFCAQCGTHNWSSRAEATKGGLPAAAPLQCDHSDSDDAADTHCWKCGLDLKQLDPSLRRQHSSSCKGYSAEPDRCCCYCGMIFWTGPNQERQARRTKHLQECLAKLQPGVQLGLILQGRNDLSSARVELPRPTVRKKRLLPQKDRQRRTKPDVARADTTDSSESDRPIRKKAKGKAVKPTRRRVDLSWSNDDDDDDESSSGERGRQTGQQRDSRRRAESPDWTKKLGPEDPNFVPRDHYCSRCFRKAPKIPNRPQKVGPDKIDVHQQIDSHTDKTRCCRIRNAEGVAKNLPNRSGWIPNEMMPKPLGIAKKKFSRQYPAYARTIYPLYQTHNTTNVWQSDPNNQSNKDAWNLPWPAFKGQPPFPDGFNKIPGKLQGEEPRDRRGKNMPKPKGEVDHEYSYESDEDSADGMEADEDDLSQKQNKKPNETKPTPAKNRRRQDTDDVAVEAPAAEMQVVISSPPDFKFISEDELEDQAVKNYVEGQENEVARPSGSLLNPLGFVSRFLNPKETNESTTTTSAMSPPEG